MNLQIVTEDQAQQHIDISDDNNNDNIIFFTFTSSTEEDMIMIQTSDDEDSKEKENINYHRKMGTSCSICLEHIVEPTMILQCKHILFCQNCLCKAKVCKRKIGACPICRKCFYFSFRRNDNNGVAKLFCFPFYFV